MWLRLLPLSLRRRVAGRPVFQAILGNSLWLAADKVLRLGFGVAVAVWIARYLGPAQYGDLNFAVAFVALFSVMAAGGMDQVVIRHIVLSNAVKDEWLGTAFMIRLLGGLASLVTAIAVIMQMRPDDTRMHLLVAVIGITSVFQAFDVIDYWYQAKVMARYAVVARNAAFLAMAATRVVLIVLHAPLIAFAWAIAAEAALAATGLVVSYRISGARIFSWMPRWTRMKALLSEAWPLLISSVAVMAYVKVDQLMLGEMAGSEAVGVYAAATRLSEAWYFIPMAIVSSAFPAVIAAKTLGREHYWDQVAKLVQTMVTLAYCVAVPVSIFATAIVVTVFGEAYRSSGPVLVVHIWSAVFVFLGVVQTPWNVNEGLNRLTLVWTTGGALVNIALNWILIPRYGALGAAIATLISYGCVSYLANAIFPQTRAMFRVQTQALLLRHLWTAKPELPRTHGG
jgi:PST family polysaccharide transporter